MASLTYVGYIIALIGGILILINGILYLVAAPFLAFSLLAAFGTLGNAIIKIVLGIVCIIGSKFVGNLGWAIVLIILGILAADIGGVLVIIGALLGLVSRL